MLNKIAFQFFRKVNPQAEAGVPSLETKRLRLRAPLRSDYPNILELGSDPEVMRYISNGKIQSPKEARADLERRIELSRGRHGYWIAEDRASATFIGWMALRPLSHTDHFELGYRFLRRHWGKGYATEAGQRLLQYAFHELKLTEVVAITLPENQASRRVMEKLGFQLKGYDTHYGFKCVVYQQSNRDFQI
ncbi:MAG TPA: GNAT family N-acetyltransferase [Saprospiraceae bacterium]|nr:GNAT family N-acetyltransferase [Saprospiraceae bacterium]